MVVFGGDHADVPLEAHAGRMLPHALVEHGFAAVFDVGLMLTDDQIRFMFDLCEILVSFSRENGASLQTYDMQLRRPAASTDVDPREIRTGSPRHIDAPDSPRALA